MKKNYALGLVLAAALCGTAADGLKKIPVAYWKSATPTNTFHGITIMRINPAPITVADHLNVVSL